MGVTVPVLDTVTVISRTCAASAWYMPASICWPAPSMGRMTKKNTAPAIRAAMSSRLGHLRFFLGA